jgi:hypothetical protein
MPDAIEEAKSVAFILDTRSVYNRIGMFILFKLKFIVCLFF